MKKAKVKNPKGAGRKPRFKPELGETTTFSCRVPKVKKQELIDYVAVKLAEWSQGSTKRFVIGSARVSN